MKDKLLIVFIIITIINMLANVYLYRAMQTDLKIEEKQTQIIGVLADKVFGQDKESK